MNKKILTIILVLSHLLCILLGYCIARIQLDTEEIDVPTETKTEVTNEAATTEPEETIVPTEEETKEAAATEVTSEPTKETESTTEPMETVPTYTQPPATQPSETQPEATEIPDIDVGENGLPIL